VTRGPTPAGSVDRRTAEPGNDACIACGGLEASVVLFRDRPVARCARCGLRWLVEPPNADELAELYTSGFYSPGAPRGGPLSTALHRLNNSIRLREIRDVAPGRLLDVGCGKGRFLAAARDDGWQVVGVEFAPSLAASARLHEGVEVIAGDFLDAPLEGDFDVVTMWHVLEHLPDPPRAVARAVELLRPGGRLVVSVPNIDSLQARLGGEEWLHLDLPRHLFHFSPRSLATLVKRAGLQVLRIGHFYPEMEMIGLVQTTLNSVGIERDLLYRFAKHDSDVVGGGPVYLSLALAVGLTPIAVAWSGIAPLLRTGASIQLVASRD
jgi:SAM-dependent methyltransferase